MLRYRAMLLFFWFACWTPRSIAYDGLSSLIAGAAFRFNGRARAVAERTMRQALGPSATPEQVSRAARGCFRAATNYYIDLARTPRMKPARFLKENLRVSGIERLERGFASGKGLILATIHYGNPEYVAHAFAARGMRFYALTEPIEPPEMYALFQRLRSSQGNTFLPVEPASIRSVIRHLRSGGAVCIVTDRDIQHTGVPIDFLGATAMIPSGAADLARSTGAALIPAITRRTTLDRFHIVFGAPIPIQKTKDPAQDRLVNVTALMRWFEPFLRRDPSQWFVLQEPIWRDEE